MRAGTIPSIVGVIFAVAAFSGWAGATNTPPETLPSRSMLTMGGIVTRPERRATPAFAGKDLPLPPRQKAAWAPPASGLPTNYLTATTLLFAQGLADPRGCEYCEIEVGTGEVWGGDAGVVKTHGWALPGPSGQRFAVCWNGLVYPALSVGAKASLEADVTLLETNGLTTWYAAIPEPMSVSCEYLGGVKGCLLLRLGRGDLAARYWQAQQRRSEAFRTARWSRTPAASSTNQINLPDTDPYLGWATEWAWALFDRTICAHIRGDEKLALLTARDLARVQPVIETACERRGFKRPRNYGGESRQKEKPYLDFLEQLPQLLADLERREREGPHPGSLNSGLTNVPDRAQRISALIRDLDLVSARQWGQPGGVNLAEDGVVAALIQEGGAAVEPLLDCLEHDQRLTRSVGFGRDFHRARTVIAVNRAAWVALQTILQAGFANAAEMRAYWNQYQTLKLEERWYAILQDDSARGRWQEAAANIVQSENVTRFPGGFSMERPAPTHAPLRLRGECLREKRHPSVTELLARHALEVPTTNVAGYDLAWCCQLAESLAAWDVQAALPVATTLSRRASTAMKYSGAQLGGWVTRLALARARAGDPTAFDDYAAWIVTTSPQQFEQSNLECFEPLRKFPTNALLQAAAQKLFGQTNSAWGSLPWKHSFGRSTVEDELVALAGYRALLCRELQKTNDSGSVTLERPGYLGYHNSVLNQSGSFGFTLPENSSATKGSTARVRWCDAVAIALAQGKHIAPFDPFASTATRDRAIQTAIARLTEGGD